MASLHCSQRIRDLKAIFETRPETTGAIFRARGVADILAELWYQMEAISDERKRKQMFLKSYWATETELTPQQRAFRATTNGFCLLALLLILRASQQLSEWLSKQLSLFQCSLRVRAGKRKQAHTGTKVSEKWRHDDGQVNERQCWFMSCLFLLERLAG